MAQQGEHYGHGEQSPWTWTSETGHQRSIPPRRPSATQLPTPQWPDQPLATPEPLREAPSSPAPAPRASRHHRRETGRRSRWVPRFAGGLALVLLGAGAYFGIDSWLFDDERRFSVPTGCAAQVQLRLAVAPEIAPLVERASGEVDVAACPTVAITPLEPGQTATILTGGEFDGIVPASSAWLRLAPSPG